MGRDADTYAPGTDIGALIGGDPACVFVDEAQFLTEPQVWQLAALVDERGIPVMAYGLRVDFQGKLFPRQAPRSSP